MDPYVGFRVSINGGTPKSMVYNFIMENTIKMDDLGVLIDVKGTPISGNLQMVPWGVQC
jgi:hypothetical protein